jgi:2-dehydropantoate 2-reductase
MSVDPIRPLVIGAGAIGGITAALLAQAGHDPLLVAKHQDTVEAVSTQGLRVFGHKGDRRVRLRAVKDIAQVDYTPEVVFLATKATDMLDAARDLAPKLGPDSLVVSLQNGICEEALGKVLGPERVMGCVVGWGATMHAPAELEMTSGGEFVLGTLDNRPEPRLSQLADMLSAVAPTRVSANILGELYGKLIINSCITALGGVCGLYLGRMLALRRARELFFAVMREAMAVAAAMNLTVAPGGGGKLDYYSFLADQGWLAQTRRHLMLRVTGFKFRRLKSSTLQSLERGRPTEIDYLNGYISAKGREHGIATPLNDAIVAMIKEIESGARPIAPPNLEALPLPSGRA